MKKSILKIFPNKAVAVFRKSTVGTLCVIAAFLFIMSTGCAKNEKEIDSLLGTKWKFVGYVDVQTGVLREVVPRGSYLDPETGRIKDGEPKDCERCYTLTLKNRVALTTDKGYSATGWSIGNQVWIDFYYPLKISSTNIPFLKKPSAGGTRVGESPEPSLYTETLTKLTSYICYDDQLKFFYDEDKNYMLFKLIESLEPFIKLDVMRLQQEYLINV
jgi:hypothetical protein